MYSPSRFTNKTQSVPLPSYVNFILLGWENIGHVTNFLVMPSGWNFPWMGIPSPLSQPYHRIHFLSNTTSLCEVVLDKKVQLMYYAETLHPLLRQWKVKIVVEIYIFFPNFFPWCSCVPFEGWDVFILCKVRDTNI